jgi:hypothetical protein
MLPATIADATRHGAGSYAAGAFQRCYQRWPSLLPMVIHVATSEIAFWGDSRRPWVFCYVHILFMLHLVS